MKMERRLFVPPGRRLLEEERRRRRHENGHESEEGESQGRETEGGRGGGSRAGGRSRGGRDVSDDEETFVGVRHVEEPLANFSRHRSTNRTSVYYSHCHTTAPPFSSREPLNGLSSSCSRSSYRYHVASSSSYSSASHYCHDHRSGPSYTTSSIGQVSDSSKAREGGSELMNEKGGGETHDSSRGGGGGGSVAMKGGGGAERGRKRGRGRCSFHPGGGGIGEGVEPKMYSERLEEEEKARLDEYQHQVDIMLQGRPNQVNAPFNCPAVSSSSSSPLHPSSSHTIPAGWRMNHGGGGGWQASYIKLQQAQRLYSLFQCQSTSHHVEEEDEDEEMRGRRRRDNAGKKNFSEDREGEQASASSRPSSSSEEEDRDDRRGHEDRERHRNTRGPERPTNQEKRSQTTSQEISGYPSPSPRSSGRSSLSSSSSSSGESEQEEEEKDNVKGSFPLSGEKRSLSSGEDSHSNKQRVRAPSSPSPFSSRRGKRKKKREGRPPLSHSSCPSQSSSRSSSGGQPLRDKSHGETKKRSSTTGRHRHREGEGEEEERRGKKDSKKNSSIQTKKGSHGRRGRHQREEEEHEEEEEGERERGGEEERKGCVGVVGESRGNALEETGGEMAMIMNMDEIRVEDLEGIGTKIVLHAGTLASRALLNRLWQKYHQKGIKQFQQMIAEQHANLYRVLHKKRQLLLTPQQNTTTLLPPPPPSQHHGAFLGSCPPLPIPSSSLRSSSFFFNDQTSRGDKSDLKYPDFLQKESALHKGQGCLRRGGAGDFLYGEVQEDKIREIEEAEEDVLARRFYFSDQGHLGLRGGGTQTPCRDVLAMLEEEERQEKMCLVDLEAELLRSIDEAISFYRQLFRSISRAVSNAVSPDRRRRTAVKGEESDPTKNVEEEHMENRSHNVHGEKNEEEEESKRNIIASQTDDRSLEERKKERRRSGEKEQEGEEACSRRDRGGSKEDLENEKRLNASARRARGDKGVKERSSGRKEGNPVEGGADVSNETTRLELQMERRKQRKSEEGQQSLGLQRGKEGDELDRHQDARMGRRHEHRQQRDNAEEREEKEKNDVLLQRKRCARHLLCLVSTVLGDLQRYREQLDPPPSPFLPPSSPFTTAKKWPGRSVIPQPLSSSLSPPPARLVSPALDESSVSNTERERREDEEGEPRRYHRGARISPPRVQQASSSSTASYDILRSRGDLTRFYLGLFSTEFAPCLRQAFGFYARAIRTFPHDGLVFNQMAMLCTKLHHHSHKSLQQFLGGSAREREAKEGGQGVLFHESKKDGKREDDIFLRWLEYRKTHAASHAVGALYWCLRAHICAFPLRTSDGLLLLLQRLSEEYSSSSSPPPPHPPSSSSFIDERLQQPSPSPSQVKCLSTPLLKATPQKGGFLGMPSSSSSSSSSLRGTTQNVWMEREEVRKKAADLFLTALTDSSSSPQEVFDQTKSSPVSRVFLFLFFQLLYRLQSQTDLSHFHLHANECLRYLRLLISFSGTSSDQDTCTVTQAYPSSSSQDEDGIRRQERERRRIRDVLVKMLSLESLLLFCLFSSLACALEASRGCRRMQRNISDILHPGRMKERIAQKEEGRRRDGGEESHGKPDGKKKDKKNVQTPAKETEEEEEEERKKEEEGKGRSREKTCTRVDRRRDKTDADTWKKKDQHSSSENLSYPSSHRNSHSKTAEREGKDRESDSKKQRKAGDDKEEEEQQPPPKSLTVEVYRHVPLSLARVSKLAEVVREGYCKRENLSFSSSTSESSALGEVNEKAEVGEVKKEEEGQEKGKEEKREVQAKKKTKKKKEKEEEDDDETEQEKEGEEGCSLVVLLSFQLCCDMSTCLVDEAYSIVRTFRRNERSGHLGKLAACLSFLRVEEEEERRSEKEKNQEKDQERKTLDDTKMKKKKKEKKKNDELFLITEERRGSFFTNEEGEEEEDQDENLLIMAAILLGPVCQFLMLLRAHQDLYAFTDFLPIQVLRHQVANVSLLLFPPLLDETRSKKRQSLLLSLLPLQLPHDFVLVGLLDAPLTFPPEWPYQRERVLSLLQTPSPPITQPGKTGDLRHDDGVEEKEKKSLSSASREDQRRGRTEEEEEEKDRCQEEEEKRRERGTSEEIERDKKDLQGKKEEDEDDESEELLLLNRPIFCIPQSSRETVPISSSSSEEEDPRNLHDRKEQQHANTKEGEKEDKTHLHTEVKEEKKGDTQGNLLNDSSSAHLSPKTSAFSSSLSKPSSSSSSPATKSGLGSSRCSPSSSSPHDACSSSSLLFSIYPVISVTEPLPQKGEEEADRGFLLSSLSSPSRTSSSSSSSALTWICVVQFARLWALSVDTPEFRRVYAHARQYLLQSHHRANLERLKEKRLGKREERILSRKSERTEKREMSGSLEDTSAEVREEVQREEEEEEIEERLKISIKRDDPTGEEGEDVSYASNLTTSVLLSTEETSSLGRDVSASSFSRSFLSSSPDEDMPHEDAKDKQDSTAPHHPSLKTHVTSQVTATLLSQINYRWGSTNKKEKQGNLYRTKEETSLSREEPSPLNGEMDKETNYSGSKHVAPVEEEEECDMEKKRKEPQGSPRDTRDDDIYYGFDPRDFVRDEDLHALNLEERGEKKEKDEDGDNSFVPYYYSSRHHRGRRRRPRSRSASSDPSRMDEEEEEREREEEEEEERIKKMNEDEIEKRAIQQEEQREEEREESISSMNRRMVAIESSSRDQETTEGKTRRDGDTDSGDEEEEAEEEKKSVKTIEKKRGGILLLPRPPLNLILPSSCRFTSSRTSQNRLTSSSASPPPSGYLDAAQSTIGPTATTTSTTTTSSSSCLPPSPGGLMKSSHYPLPSSSSLCTPSSSGDTSAPFSSVPSEGDPPPQHGSGKNLTTSANRRNRFYFSSRHPSTLHSTVSKTAACSSRPTRQQHHHYQGDQPYYQVVSSHSSSSSLHLPPSNSFSPPSHPSGRLPYPPSTYCSTHHLLLHSPLPHKATPRGPLPPPAPSHVLVSTASSPKTLSSSSSSSSPMLAVQKARGGDPSAQTISSSTGKTAATLTTTTAGGGGGGLVSFSSSMSRKTGISTTTTTVTPQGKASSSSSSFSSSARSTTSFRQSFTQGPLLSSSSSHNSMGRSHEGLGRGHACHKSQQRITLDQGGGIRTIVIDGSNVAMRHGGGKTGGLTKSFSTKGIQQAVDYFRTRGYNVRVFLPDYVLNYESVGEAKRMQKSTFPLKGGLETKIPDSMDVLQQLRKEGLIVATPSQDYDDSYAITYAMNHNGCIVTNDMYRDFIAKSSHIRGVKKWLRSHLISFVFVDDEFIPNPDFRWPQSTLTLTSIAETSVSSSSLSLSASPLPSLPFPSPLSGPSSHPLVVQGEKLEGHETSWAASSSSLYGKTEQDNEEKRREEEGEDEEEEHLGIEVDGEEFMPRLPPPSIPLEDVTRQEEEEEEEDEDEDDD